MTLLSSTTANEFCGSVRSIMARDACSKTLAPSSLNWRKTKGVTWPCRVPADALVSWSPRSSTGPSRNLMARSRSQVISGWSVTSGNASPHAKAANSAWSCGVAV